MLVRCACGPNSQLLPICMYKEIDAHVYIMLHNFRNIPHESWQQWLVRQTCKLDGVISARGVRVHNTKMIKWLIQHQHDAKAHPRFEPNRNVYMHISCERGYLASYRICAMISAALEHQTYRHACKRTYRVWPGYQRYKYILAVRLITKGIYQSFKQQKKYKPHF